MEILTGDRLRDFGAITEIPGVWYSIYFDGGFIDIDLENSTYSINDGNEVKIDLTENWLKTLYKSLSGKELVITEK